MAPPVPLCTQGVPARVSLHLARPVGRDAQAGKSGLALHRLTVDQLWDKYRVNWFEVRRLEIELGAGGDHDQAYLWSLSSASAHALAWTKLLCRRERGA